MISRCGRFWMHGLGLDSHTFQFLYPFITVGSACYGAMAREGLASPIPPAWQATSPAYPPRYRATARRLRLEFPGGFQQVTACGHGRVAIVLDDEVRQHWLATRLRYV
jgi:hypothetical protein